jgi:hypothetical protein
MGFTLEPLPGAGFTEEDARCVVGETLPCLSFLGLRGDGVATEAHVDAAGRMHVTLLAEAVPDEW